jgi:hypothetical protein
MKAKDYLESYRRNEIAIEKLKNEITRIDARLKGGSHSYSSDKIKTSDDNLNEKLMTECLDKRNKMNNDIVMNENVRADLVLKITSMSDYRYIDVLYKRYIECKRFELIAVEMNYDYDYVRKLHVKALEVFAQDYGLEKE